MSRRNRRNRNSEWNDWGNPDPGSGWSDAAGWDVPAHRARFPWRPLLIVLVVGSVVVGGVVLLGRMLEGPSAAARRYALAAAALDANELARRTCESRQLELLQTGVILTALSMIGEYYVGIGLDALNTDVDDLEYVTLREDAAEAEVYVSGEMRSSLVFISIPIVIDEYWLMVREDGHWKWCGHARPPAIPQLPNYLLPDE